MQATLKLTEAQLRLIHASLAYRWLKLSTNIEELKTWPAAIKSDIAERDSIERLLSVIQPAIARAEVNLPF